MRLVRSFRRASLLGGILAIAVTGSAFAHECYNASASAQGNLSKATHSQVWELAADVRELIATGSSGFISGLPVLNGCQQQAFLASWGTTGLPLVFTVGGGQSNGRGMQAQGQDGTIAEHNPNMDAKGLGGDNRGIDHFALTGDSIDAALNAGYEAAFAAAC